MEKLNKQDTPIAKAMQNQLVLQRIGKGMAISDLWKLRSTCKTWNANFVRLIREKHYVMGLCLKEGEEDKTYRTVQNLASVMNATTDFPLARFRLQYTNRAYRPEAELHDFFQLYGFSIRQLELRCTLSSNGTNAVFPIHVDKIRQILSDWVPNLVDLHLNADEVTPTLDVVTTAQSVDTLPTKNLRKLNFCSFIRGELHPKWTRLVSDLMSCSTRLEFLTLCGGANLEVLSALRDQIPAQNVCRLKGLKIDVVGRPELEILVDLSSRSQNPLRLKSLDIALMYEEDGHKQKMRLFNMFLMLQSATLHELRLRLFCQTRDLVFGQGEGEDASSTNMPLPIMPLLQVFSFHRDHELIPISRLPAPLNLTFPRLVRLEHGHRSINKYVEYENNVEALEHAGVRELVLKLENYQTLGPRFKEAYAPRFQSVTTLDVFIRGGYDAAGILEQMLQRIWTWSSLQILCLQVHSCSSKPIELDHLLSGIPTEFHEHLEHELGLNPFEWTGAGPEPISLDKIGQLVRKYKTKPSYLRFEATQEI